MFEPTTPQLQPVVAYLQANQIEILHEDRSQSGAVVLSLKMQSGAIRTLTVNSEFLQTTHGDQIESYLKDHNFARRLEEQGNQDISKPSRP